MGEATFHPQVAPIRPLPSILPAPGERRISLTPNAYRRSASSLPLESSALPRLPRAAALFILHRATVRSGAGRGHWLSSHRFFESNLNVIGCPWNISWIRRCLAVDRSFVNNLAFWVDHKHVGGVLGGIGLACLSLGVEQHCRRMCLPFRHLLLRLFRR